MPWLERNLHFLPDWVEAIAWDGINHRNERLTSGQPRVGLIDEVQVLVVLKQRLFSVWREFHKVYGQKFAVVVSRYRAGLTSRSCGACVSCGDDSQRQERRCDDFNAMRF